MVEGDGSESLRGPGRADYRSLTLFDPRLSLSLPRLSLFLSDSHDATTIRD